MFRALTSLNSVDKFVHLLALVAVRALARCGSFRFVKCFICRKCDRALTVFRKAQVLFKISFIWLLRESFVLSPLMSCIFRHWGVLWKDCADTLCGITESQSGTILPRQSVTTYHSWVGDFFNEYLRGCSPERIPSRTDGHLPVCDVSKASTSAFLSSRVCYFDSSS